MGDLKVCLRGGRRDKGRLILAMLLVSAALVSLLALSASSASAAECPNEEFRVEKSSALPDCRAYEQVTPVLKEYGAVALSPAAQVSTNGGAIAFTSEGPLPGAPSGPYISTYVARRDVSGWTVNAALPKQTPLPGGTNLPEILGFSDDLSKWTVLSADPALTPDTEPQTPNIYAVQGSGLGPFELITQPQHNEGSRVNFLIGGQSDDMSTLAMRSLEGLFGDGPAGHVYEYRDGKLAPLGFLPDGEPLESEALVLGPFAGQDSVSGEGSVIYFLGRPFGFNQFVLYARINGEATVEVGKSQKQPEDTYSVPTFWSATSDGRLAFFTSRSELTEDANTGVEQAGNDLYASNIDTGQLTDLSVDTNLADAATGANVLGVVGTSEDGAYVYYVARGVLAPGAIQGEPNLYLVHDGSVRYIDTLAPSDEANWFGTPRELVSYLSPNGQHLLLSSKARLTDYDNSDAVTGEPDTEVYLYSAGTNEMMCVSCRPDGARPTSSTSLNSELTGSMGELTYPRTPMTNDGATVVFGTGEDLVPQDSNGISDVYEYRQGQVHLLSPGNSGFSTKFLGMSPSGQDVFVSTAERLAATDKDDLIDAYDVREGGGWPPPETQARPCAGPECPRAEIVGPETSNFGSSVIEGQGNTMPQRKCPPGKQRVRKNSRTQCVVKRKSHPGGHKKHKGRQKTGGKPKGHADPVKGGKK